MSSFCIYVLIYRFYCWPFPCGKQNEPQIESIRIHTYRQISQWLFRFVHCCEGFSRLPNDMASYYSNIMNILFENGSIICWYSIIKQAKYIWTQILSNGILWFCFCVYLCLCMCMCVCLWWFFNIHIVECEIGLNRSSMIHSVSLFCFFYI